MSRIFHIATVADWTSAQASGSYSTSTLGRTLVQEGFIHASRADQWQGVRARFYADVTEPLLLLVIDTDRLTSPVVDELVGEGGETFPHVYGPINPSAVVQTIPLDGRPAPTDATFSQLFIGEVLHRVVLALIAMATAVVGALVGATVQPDLGPAVGLLIGLAVGILLAVVFHRRRR
ncbi:MAG: DUF952 domain-containing protein [Nocardioides sp.]|nr:DUF952 domain-containing protein [Nocardioides sp.]